MRISGEKRSALYSAFSARIMDLHIELRQNIQLKNAEKLDARLFKLEQQIWTDIKAVLKI